MSAPRSKLITEAELAAVVDRIAATVGKLVKEQARRIDDLRDETISLRRAMSGSGRRRYLTGEATADPDRPGFALAYLDDGSALVVRDEREMTAGSRTAGHA